MVSSRSTRVTLAVHTPGVTPPELLAAFTVGRERELDVLRETLRAAATSDNRAHLLLSGPRGSGKTHLLTLAAHMARTEPEFAGRLLVAQLPEDAYRVTDYTDLLVAVLESVGVAASGRDARGLERQVRDVTDERVLVVVVENLPRLFSLLGLVGQRALRAFVQTYGRLLLLASTPNLVEDLGDHEMPFYGFFRSLPLAELNAEQGRELLLRLAKLEGADDLGTFLASPAGLQRLQAIASLAGGSPRLWLLLAGCMTVELLDKVVPLFIELLDRLTPYYMARLEDLSPERAKLVSHLCSVRLPDASLRLAGGRTVKELAAATGMSPQAASRQLHELQRLRYVVARKVPGSDRRETFYELREPLLAHCLMMKEQHGEPLELVVRLLRTWFATPDLRAALTRSAAGSFAEGHLGAALGGDPVLLRPDFGAEHAGVLTVADLLVDARRALAGAGRYDGAVATRIGAVVAEAVALAVIEGQAAAGAAVEVRLGQVAKALRGVLADVVAAGVRAAAASLGRDGAPAASGAAICAASDGLEAALDAAAALPPEERAALTILAATWTHEEEKRATAVFDRYKALATELAGLISERTRLALEAKLAVKAWQAGERDEALRRVEQCLREQKAMLGAEDPDTLASRQSHANLVGEAGSAAAARDLFTALVEDHRRILGPDHPRTLGSRLTHAHWTAQAGDATRARDLFARLTEDSRRELDPDHPVTLASRCLAALAAVATDNVAVMVAEFRTYVDDLTTWLEYRDERVFLALATLASAVARTLSREARDPAGTTSSLRGCLMASREKPAVTFALLLALLSFSDTADQPWILSEVDAAEQPRELAGAVLGAVAAHPGSRGERLGFIDVWEGLIADRAEPAYALLGRQLAALRAAVFDQDEELLARLPPAERVPVDDSIRLLQYRLSGE